VVLPLNNLTFQSVAGSLSIEYVEAQYWNSSLKGKYIGNNTYADSVANETSAGLLSRVEIEIGPKFQLLYQFEDLALNKLFPNDSYSRHSYGFKYWVAANTSLLARWMQSSSGHPLEAASTTRWNSDAFFMVLQTAL
jgi:hypothetical protein